MNRLKNKNNPTRPPLKKGRGFLRISVFLLSAFFVFHVTVGVVYAQVFVDDVSMKAFLKGQKAEEKVEEKVEESKWQALNRSLTLGIQRAIINYTARISASIGKAIVSGGPGGKPLAFTEALSQAHLEARDSAIGDLIDSVSDGLGVDLCTPPEIRMKIGLGLFETIQPSKPKCTYAKLSENWQEAIDTARSSPEGWNQFIAVGLDPDRTETGQQLSALLRAYGSAANRLAEDEGKREVSGWWKSGENLISGSVTLPASLVEERAKELTATPKPEGGGFPKQTGNFWQDLAAVGLYNLTGSAFNAALQKVLSQGIFPAEPISKKFRKSPLSTVGSGGTSSSGTPSLPTTGTDLRLSATGTEYDLLSEMEQCPGISRIQSGTIWNCSIDGNFAEAIRQKMTVREAVGLLKTNETTCSIDSKAKQLLDGNWVFGYTGESKQNEPDFDRGYRYSNMKKLRRARIIPVGWELAAEQIRTNKLKYKNDVTLLDVLCGFDDPSPDNPFYKLVNPDWVLTTPSYTCRLEAPSQLHRPGTRLRIEQCADIQDCVAMKPDGSGCATYGYCTRERDSWNFNATSCERQFATCTEYRRETDGSTVTYLANTVSQCTSDQAGCRGYAVEKQKDNNSRWSLSKTLYLNKKAEQCPATSEGCTEFVKSTPLFKDNVVRNGGFEDGDYLTVADLKTATPTDWSSCGTGCTETRSNVFAGRIAVNPGAGGATAVQQSSIPVSANTFYTLAARVKRSENSAARIVLTFAANVPNPSQFSPHCTNGGDSKRVECRWPALGAATETATENELYESVSATVNTGSNTTIAALELQGVNATGEAANVWFDEIRLEESGRIFLDGRRQSCKGVAPVPEAAYVGCDQYSSDDGISIPAVIQARDRCPVQCVGYDLFLETKTPFAPERYTYLIPTNASACSARADGCSEFTNLDSLQAGGETREYFTELRQCQKPGPGESSYFTWEGSETAGFQLQVHTLLASNKDLGKAPCVARNLAAGICENEATEYTIVSEMLKTCKKETLGTNTDCREYYDKNGNISYRLASKTIVVNQGCVRYRKTVAVGNGETEKEKNCMETGGAWDSGNKECTYLVLPSANRRCTAEAVGCRRYKGNTSNDIVPVYPQQGQQGFEPLAGGVATIPEEWKVGIVFPVASVSTQNALKSVSKTAAVEIGSKIKKNSTYTLVFSARAAVEDATGALKLDVAFTGNNATDNSFTADRRPTGSKQQSGVGLTTEWLVYSLGPVVVTWNPLSSERLQFSSPDTDFYIDNVELREVRDEHYLIENSWVIPQACELTPNANDGLMAGCRAYSGRAGDTQYLRQFTQGCPAAYVGCEQVIDTKNSKEPGARTVAPTVEADKITYVVNDPTKYCPAADKGCMAVGVAKTLYPAGAFAVATCVSTTDPERNGKGCVDANPGEGEITKDACKIEGKGACKDTTTQYWKNNPDDYGGEKSILCTKEDVGCETYTSTSGSVSFRDPREFTCEWKSWSDGVDSRFGWFKKGTASPQPDCQQSPTTFDRHGGDLYSCYKADGTIDPTKSCADKDKVDTCVQGGGTCRLLIPNTTSPYVRACPSTANKCIALVDPSDRHCYGGNEHQKVCVPSPAAGEVTPEACVKGGGTCGKPHYVMDDFRLAASRGQCTVASIERGCILFRNEMMIAADEAGNKNPIRDGGKVLVTANSAKSYEASAGEAFPDPPVTKDDNGNSCDDPDFDDPGCDANEILKVTRDRECAEWLSCLSGGKMFDPDSQQYVTTCDAVATCTAASPTNSQQCGTYKDDALERGKLLDVALYEKRDVKFGSLEYAGHSIPFRYPLSTYRQIARGKDAFGAPADFRIGSPALMKSKIGVECKSNTDCSDPEDPQYKCLNKKCYQYLDIGIDPKTDNAKEATTKECRAYPEADAPFPDTIVSTWSKLESDDRIQNDDPPSYPCSENGCDIQMAETTTLGSDVAVGQNGQDVECSYEKTKYSDGKTRYYGLGRSRPVIKDVVGYIKDPITRILGPIISTYKIDSKDPMYGRKGYCLEWDESRTINGGAGYPCLTWLPIDLTQGEIDVNNNAPGAGYDPNPARQFYCVEQRVMVNRKHYDNRAVRQWDWSDMRYYLGIEPLLSSDGTKSYYDPALTYPTGGDVDATGAQENGRLLVKYYQGASIGATSRYTCGKHHRKCYTFDPYPQYAGWRYLEQDDRPIYFHPSSGLWEEVKLVCTKVVQITDGEGKSAAWTSRAKNVPVRGGLLSAQPTLQFSYDKTHAPFGALNKVAVDPRVAIEVGSSEAPTVYETEAETIADKTLSSPSAELNLGEKRLADVFTRQYNSWAFEPGLSCSQVCVGGPNGKSCTSHAECVADPAEFSAGTCTPVGLCQGGAVASQRCRIADDCTKAPSAADGTPAPAPTCVATVGKCDIGPDVGQFCVKETSGVDTCANPTDEHGVVTGQATCIDLRDWNPSGDPHALCKEGMNDGVDCTSSPSICTDVSGTCTAKLSNGVPVNDCSSTSFGAYTLNTARTYPQSVLGAEDTANVNGQPPRVRSVVFHPTTGVPAEGPTGLTLNRSTSGVVTQATNSYGASLAFYVYNENGQQMPLRRVTVDWGDGTDPSTILGSFKNHKETCRRFCSNTVDANGNPTAESSPGVLDSKVDKDKGLTNPKQCSTHTDCPSTGFCNFTSKPSDGSAWSGTCAKKPTQCRPESFAADCAQGNVVNTCRVENWGDMIDACTQNGATGVPGYFIFTHVYRCGGAPGAKCSFTPRVQVLDNWGWCNGQKVTADVGVGTYKRGGPQTVDGLRDIDNDGWDDVCDATKGGCYNNPNEPNRIKACGVIEAAEDRLSAWTYFDGKIELTVPVEL